MRIVWRAFFAYPLVRFEGRVARVRATEVFDAMVARAARTSPSTAAAEG